MSQSALVLRLLREAGPEGVDAWDLVYRHGITRGAAVIHDLRVLGGHDIETNDRGTTDDRRPRLATYVLRGAPGRQVPPLDQPAAPLVLPCGCVRAAGGMSWESRCDRHEGGAKP
jgi:hypothetical protein